MNIAQPLSNSAAAHSEHVRSGSDRLSDTCFFLFIATAAVGLVQTAWPIEFGSGFEMVDIANNLALNGSFANPFAVQNTGPTATMPPAYPFFLGVIIRTLGSVSNAALVATIENIVANGTVSALLPRVSLLLFADYRPGAVAACIWLASARLMPSWDASFTAATLLAFILFSASVVGKRSGVRAGFACGAFAGAMCLLNPASLIVSFSWVTHLLIRVRLSFRTVVKYVVALGLGVVLAAGGWAIRNAYVMDSAVLRTNFGIALYVSNNDCAQPSFRAEQNNGCHQAYHPNENLAEARVARTLGEVAYDKDRASRAREWMRKNPTAFLSLTLRRIEEFWFPRPPGEPAFSATVICVGTVLSFAGLGLLASRRHSALAFFAGMMLIYPAVYYIVIIDVRYRYPILWATYLLAGYFVVAIVSRLRKGTRLHGISARSPEEPSCTS